MQYFKGVSRLAIAAALASLALTAIPAAADPAPTPQQIQQFLSNPGALLSQFPQGGPQLASEVAKLAADPSTLAALTALLQTANPQEAAAIGQGLGEAANQAVKTNQAYATQIQQAVVGAHSSPALVAFDAAVGGNVQLAAAGGGGGGGGGGESPTGQNSGGGGFAGGNPFNGPGGTNNTADNFTFGNFSPSSASGTTTNTSTTTTTSNVSSTTFTLF